MGLKKLDRLFDPRVIAVIGASDDQESVGYGVMKNIIKGGFKGKIYPVNIKRKKVWGLTAYKSILDIPQEVTLAIVATPAPSVVDLVAECGRKNVLNVIVMSSGFNEAGKKGIEMSNKIAKTARTHNMRIMGPNCMGFIRPHMNLNLTFANDMPREGNIAFISQSGALGSATLDWAKKHDFGFSFFASLGSMIDIGFSDVIDFLGNDPHTNSILIYMESLKDARRFLSAARSFSRTKPIVVLKVGKSEQGARAALSHTGNLAGNDDVFDAAFKRAGIIRVREIDELFDCARTLSKQKRPLGKKLAIVTNAGGPGVISTDFLVERGGELAKLSDKTIRELNASLPVNWSKGNPVDILGDAKPQDYKKAVELCLQDEGVDGVLTILTPQSMTDSVKVAEEIIKIKKLHDKPLLASWMGGRSIEKGTDILEKEGIPVFIYPERAVKSFMYLYDYTKNLDLLYQTPSTIPHAFDPKTDEIRKLIEKVVREKRFVLTSDEAKEMLSNYFIPVSKSGLARSVGAALAIAKKIGFPVAMKISSSDVLHKTDVGGVILDVNNEVELRDAYREILSNVKRKMPKARIDGVIVEEMSGRKYELIIGCKKDPIFGPAIVFGMGGVAVNVFKDTKVGLPPLNMALAKRLMEETKIYKLLQGYRGMEGADIDAIQFLLYKFAYLISDFPEIKEVDMNPVSVDASGSIVLDAKIILDEDYIKSNKSARPYSHLVISPYPKEYIKKIKTRSGKNVLLRPIKPEDEPLEAEMFKSFSKQTEKFRFFGRVKEITHELLIKYTQIDYDREIAIIAEIEEGGKKKMAGVVRIISDPYDDSAEFAIVVGDPWQGSGIGEQMTDYILSIAKGRGVKTVYAYFLPDNGIMQHIFEKRGFHIIKEDEVFRAELTF